jgi:hypothetical protein
MKAVRGGWVALAEGGKSFPVDGQRATGVYLSLTRTRVNIYYAGVDGDANEGMALPADPHLLADLAKVLRAAARSLEKTDYPWLHPFV